MACSCCTRMGTRGSGPRRMRLPAELRSRTSCCGAATRRPGRRSARAGGAARGGGAGGGGVSRMFDASLVFNLAYATALGFQASWGAPNNIAESVRWDADVQPVLMQQLTTEKLPLFEFVRLVSRLPAGGFLDGPAPRLFSGSFFSIQALGP